MSLLVCWHLPFYAARACPVKFQNKERGLNFVIQKNNICGMPAKRLAAGGVLNVRHVAAALGPLACPGKSLYVVCRDEHVWLFYITFVHNSWTANLVRFFSIVQNIIDFVCSVIFVHFPSISFVFSLNNRSVKSFVQKNILFKKIDSYLEVFRKNI